MPSKRLQKFRMVAFYCGFVGGSLNMLAGFLNALDGKPYWYFIIIAFGLMFGTGYIKVIHDVELGSFDLIE